MFLVWQSFVGNLLSVVLVLFIIIIIITEERDNSEYLGPDEMIMLKWILSKSVEGCGSLVNTVMVGASDSVKHVEFSR
jgi:hypothetical protein